jgi:hypothetical protein
MYVVRVPGYRSRGTGSIPATTRLFREVVALERGPLSLMKLRSYLEKKNIGSGLEI